LNQIELSIDSIAAGGDGVGRSDGMVVFVPRAAPGDVLRVSTVRRDRLLRGRIVDIVSPSPQRVEPPCQHYRVDRCGGCQIQHLEYGAQRAAKSRIIGDALTRIGRLQVEPPAVEASPEQWRYRRKLTLAIRRRGDVVVAGLRRFDDPDSVFQLQDCLITSERVMEDWRSVLAHTELLPRAAELRAAVRLLPVGFSFFVEGGRSWPGSAALFDTVPRMTQLWWQPQEKGRRLVLERSEGVATGASFVQVNPEVATRLREWVLEIATRDNPRTAIDAYAGTGDIAVALAERGTRVTAIEIDRDAVRSCAARLPEGSRAIAAPVERAIGDALPADLVILNPPRGGLDPHVADTLRSHPEAPRRVIYISCNPATLARDLRRMERYRVASLRGFDMFPQTAHVETVCELAA
jgi:23S rRNA (uracil1939-C5)-methyltransferase